LVLVKRPGTALALWFANVDDLLCTLAPERFEFTTRRDGFLVSISLSLKQFKASIRKSEFLGTGETDDAITTGFHRGKGDVERRSHTRAHHTSIERIHGMTMSKEAPSIECPEAAIVGLGNIGKTNMTVKVWIK
jgi:hypothetical protein